MVQDGWDEARESELESESDHPENQTEEGPVSTCRQILIALCVIVVILFVCGWVIFVDNSGSSSLYLLITMLCSLGLWTRTDYKV